MSFLHGAKDGKHYWLTPPELYERLDEEFDFDCDPCPYPLPQGYDGLKADWGGLGNAVVPLQARIAFQRLAGIGGCA